MFHITENENLCILNISKVKSVNSIEKCDLCNFHNNLYDRFLHAIVHWAPHSNYFKSLVLPTLNYSMLCNIVISFSYFQLRFTIFGLIANETLYIKD